MSQPKKMIKLEKISGLWKLTKIIHQIKKWVFFLKKGKKSELCIITVGICDISPWNYSHPSPQLNLHSDSINAKQCIKQTALLLEANAFIWIRTQKDPTASWVYNSCELGSKWISVANELGRPEAQIAWGCIPHWDKQQTSQKLYREILERKHP